MQEITTGYGLIEGPVWDAERGLYFSDVLNGGVFLLGKDGETTQVIQRRRGVGGMALHASGGLVISGRDISYAPLAETGGAVLLGAEAAGGIGFNDLTTDAQGRVYVGSLAFRVFGGEEPKPGHLHRINLDGGMETLSDGVMLTNGLGFSPDGSRLYHSDSRAPGVRVYDVAADGAVGPWRLFANLGERWTPDGLKVAADGSVWVADARGGRVAVFEPNGAHRMDLKVPMPMVTSLCFGGDDLRELYVMTGSDGGPRENCGTIYRVRTEVAGLPLSPARVAI
jgi:xylono-1,5-lactonase